MGSDSIVDKTLKAFQELKYCMDGCWDSSGSAAVIATEPISKALKELIKRGISTRYLTDINKDNFPYCTMMAEDGHHLRHLAGIKSNLDRLERNFYKRTCYSVPSCYQSRKYD
jgi:hypothetical protein